MDNDSCKYYGDIINMPHRISNIHAPMNVLNRAAQFAPFSALPGHSEAVKETERITETSYSLDEEEKERINYILQNILYNTNAVNNIYVKYFIADEKYANLARKNGLPAFTNEEAINSLIAKVRELNEKLEIPKSLQEAGIDEQDFLANVDELADRAFEDQCTTANPRLPLVTELKQILLDAYYGK